MHNQSSSLFLSSNSSSSPQPSYYSEESESLLASASPSSRRRIRQEEQEQRNCRRPIRVSSSSSSGLSSGAALNESVPFLSTREGQEQKSSYYGSHEESVGVTLSSTTALAPVSAPLTNETMINSNGARESVGWATTETASLTHPEESSANTREGNSSLHSGRNRVALGTGQTDPPRENSGTSSIENYDDRGNTSIDDDGGDDDYNENDNQNADDTGNENENQNGNNGTENVDDDEEDDTGDSGIATLTRRLRCLFSTITWPIVPLGTIVALALVWVLYSAFVLDLQRSCSHPLHWYAMASLLLLIYAPYHAQVRSRLFHYSRERDGPIRPARVRRYDQVFHTLCLLYVYGGVTLVQSCREDTTPMNDNTTNALSDNMTDALLNLEQEIPDFMTNNAIASGTAINSCAATCPNLYQALSVYVATLEVFTFALILPLLFLPCLYLWFLRRATAEAEAFAHLQERLQEEEGVLLNNTTGVTAEEILDSLQKVKLVSMQSLNNGASTNQNATANSASVGLGECGDQNESSTPDERTVLLIRSSQSNTRRANQTTNSGGATALSRNGTPASTSESQTLTTSAAAGGAASNDGAELSVDEDIIESKETKAQLATPLLALSSPTEELPPPTATAVATTPSNIEKLLSGGKSNVAKSDVKECCICMTEFHVEELNVNDVEITYDIESGEQQLTIANNSEKQNDEKPQGCEEEEEIIVLTKCGHIFHKGCLAGWVGGRWSASTTSDTTGESNNNNNTSNNTHDNNQSSQATGNGSNNGNNVSRRRRARRTCCPLCREDLRPNPPAPDPPTTSTSSHNNDETIVSNGSVSIASSADDLTTSSSSNSSATSASSSSNDDNTTDDDTYPASLSTTEPAPATIPTTID